MALTIISPVTQAIDSATLYSDSGDTLMIHRLNSGEIWGSFIITDQIADSFADHELIVLQVDQHQPIKLDYQKQCGGGAREKQQYSYNFARDEDKASWQFSHIETNHTDFLKLAGWDKEQYQHMRSDRRPEVVDFPIDATLAVEALWSQFRSGEKVVFHYTTESGEVRDAVFMLQPIRATLDDL